MFQPNSAVLETQKTLFFFLTFCAKAIKILNLFQGFSGNENYRYICNTVVFFKKIKSFCASKNNLRAEDWLTCALSHIHLRPLKWHQLLPNKLPELSTKLIIFET
jgi:hypothetical protein